MADRDPRPWYVRHPLTLPRGYELSDCTIILYGATTACDCQPCKQVFDEIFGPDWQETARGARGDRPPIEKTSGFTSVPSVPARLGAER